MHSSSQRSHWLAKWLRENYASWREAAEGNCLRTRRTRDKSTLCEDSDKLMRARGLRVSSEGGTRKAIIRLESEMVLAWSMLRKENAHGVVTLDTCGQVLMKRVLQYCPHFNALATTMTAHVLLQTGGESRRKKGELLKIQTPAMRIQSRRSLQSLCKSLLLVAMRVELTIKSLFKLRLELVPTMIKKARCLS